MYLHTLSFGKRYPRLFTPNDKDIALSCSERVVDSILDVHDVETSIMSFSMCNHTHTAHVAATSDHGNDSSIELDKLCNFPRRQLDLDCIVDLDRRIGVTNPSRPTPCVSCLARNLPKLGPTTESTQQTYVRASCVTKNGTPPRPNWTLLTLPSLYSASSVVMRWTVKRPLVS